MDLIDKLASWMEGSSTADAFSEEERRILETIEEFGVIRKQEEASGDADALFRTLEREKEVSFRLKSLLFVHMDRLLAGGSMEKWMELMAWHNLVGGRKLMDRFWEFHILKILTGICMEELSTWQQGGGQVCMLRFRSIAELLEGYFQALFLLRRLEYGIEPQEEIVDYIRDKGLSFIYIDRVVDNSQIREKEMVKKAVRELCGKYGIG